MAKVIQVAEVTFKSNKDEIKAAADDVILDWLEAIGGDAAHTAASKAPVDTGRLKNSIEHAVVPSEKAAYIGTNVEYAPYQEFGTSRGVVGKHFIQYGATAHAAAYGRLLNDMLKTGDE